MLKFPNGQILCATASAESSGDIIRYNFEGDVSRLKPLVERGTIGFFKWYLHSCAVNTSAEIQVSSTGEFEAEKPR